MLLVFSLILQYSAKAQIIILFARYKRNDRKLALKAVT